MDSNNLNAEDPSHPKEDKVRCDTCYKTKKTNQWYFLYKGTPYCDIKCLRTKKWPKESRCHACKKTFYGSCPVIRFRGQIYHKNCLRCAICEKVLKPGDKFVVVEKKIVCLKHGGFNEGIKTLQRDKISSEQRLSLLIHYERCKYPNPEMRAAIAKELNLNEFVVKVWFQNWRARNSD